MHLTLVGWFWELLKLLDNLLLYFFLGSVIAEVMSALKNYSGYSYKPYVDYISLLLPLVFDILLSLMDFHENGLIS